MARLKSCPCYKSSACWARLKQWPLKARQILRSARDDRAWQTNEWVSSYFSKRECKSRSFAPLTPVTWSCRWGPKRAAERMRELQGRTSLGLNADVELDLGAVRVGGALVIDLVVGEEGAFAAQIFRRHSPDFLPQGGDDFGDRPAIGGEDRIGSRRNFSIGHTGRKIVHRRNARSEQIGVIALFVAVVIGVNDDGVCADAMGNLRGEVLLVEVLPELADHSVARCFLGVVGSRAEAGDVERIFGMGHGS